jgi:2-polyprenyl-3-methyl-5-hydroxy-6-metoxy-1,4-benzoquinol methylase
MDKIMKTKTNTNLELIQKVAKKHSVSLSYIQKSLQPDYKQQLLKDSKIKFFIKNFCPNKNDAVLDVGCFIGFQVNILSKKYPDVQFSGCDIIPEFIDLAKHEFTSTNCKFYCEDVLTSKRPKPSSLDHIFFFEVLEHVDSPKVFLDKFNQLLKKGGKLYLSTPSALGITNVLLNIKNRSLAYIPLEKRNTGTEKDHIYVWDKLTLMRLLDRSGFKLVKWYTSRKFSIREGQSLCFIVEKK